ncbi:MAG: hypothetical protein KZQ87_18815 [Candidatus Thiodiazotropha sp. (ex Cardiolucina cf. quadrata)]|nr:hypothetical protein [Candidatus Thiodiazotropha sp. (ex Cardiolucina cf. quadrata)]
MSSALLFYIYEAEALGYKLLEIDGDGRTTRYDVGRFGQVHGMTVSGGDTAHRQGNSIHTEDYTLDWQGRRVAVSDNYGKEIYYTYDDADRLRRIQDVTTDKLSDYSYNAGGQRVHEVLYIDGAEVRNQSFGYNSRGWLTSVDTQINYSDAGINLNQAFHASYRYDELGNRVRSNDRGYVYDANNRMTTAYDGRNEVVINSIAYDGFGNRTRISSAAGTVDYSYDLNNRVVGSSAGESWLYDEVGNTTRHNKTGGEYTTSEYDAANRTVQSFSHSRDDNGDWSDVTTHLVYDGAGNVVNTMIRASDYGFDELAYYDVRYNVQRKQITNSYVEGAKYLYGDAYFSYDENGVLSACPPNRHSPKTAPNMTHSRLFFRLFPKPSLNYVRSIAFFTPI